MLGRWPLKNTTKTDIKRVCEGVLVDIYHGLVKLQDILEELGEGPGMGSSSQHAEGTPYQHVSVRLPASRRLRQ